MVVSCSWSTRSWSSDVTQSATYRGRGELSTGVGRCGLGRRRLRGRRVGWRRGRRRGRGRRRHVGRGAASGGRGRLGLGGGGGLLLGRARTGAAAHLVAAELQGLAPRDPVALRELD